MSRTRFTPGTYLEAIDPFRFSPLKSMASGHAFFYFCPPKAETWKLIEIVSGACESIFDYSRNFKVRLFEFAHSFALSC